MEKWKQWLLLCIVGVLGGSSPLHAQVQLPVSDFEDWTQAPFTSYEEPTGGWWTTLNGLSGLGCPVTVIKTTDAHSGTYAAKLTTLQWGTLTIPGLLLSGEFDIQNPNFLVQGQPFTQVPTSFRGWYKFNPIAGDSAAIAALLVRWNASAQRRDTLGLAVLSVTDTVSNWTMFDLPFVFWQQGVTPDSILVALVSSGDGQNFNGQVGSTLWIDDLELDYTTAVAPVAGEAENPIAAIVAERIRIICPASWMGAEFRLTSISGFPVTQRRIKSMDEVWTIGCSGGAYIAEFTHPKLGHFSHLVFAP